MQIQKLPYHVYLESEIPALSIIELPVTASLVRATIG